VVVHIYVHIGLHDGWLVDGLMDWLG
jgi:hypothetical protein